MDSYGTFNGCRFENDTQLSEVLQSAVDLFPETNFYVDGKALHFAQTSGIYDIVVAGYLRKQGGVFIS